MTAERHLFDFLVRKYVQRADNRQRSLGLQYTTAETHDLARTLDNWLRAEGGWTPPPGVPGAHLTTCAKPGCGVHYYEWRHACPNCRMPNPAAPRPPGAL